MIWGCSIAYEQIMKLLENILVPIDINTDSEEQINVAIQLANVYKSEIILMYVISEMELSGNIKHGQGNTVEVMGQKN